MKALLAILAAACLTSAAQAAEPPLLFVAPAGHEGDWYANAVILEGEPRIAATVLFEDRADEPVVATLRNGETLEILSVQHHREAFLSMLMLGPDAPPGWPLDRVSDAFGRDVFMIDREGARHPARLGVTPIHLRAAEPIADSVEYDSDWPVSSVLLTQTDMVAGLITRFNLWNTGQGFVAPASLLRRLRDDFVAGEPGGWGRTGFSVADGHGPPTVSRIYEPRLAALVRPGDRIWAIDGHPVQNAGHFRRQILFSRPGATLQIDIRRSGALETIDIDVLPGGAVVPFVNSGVGVAPLTPAYRERNDLPTGMNGLVIALAPDRLRDRGLRVGDELVAFDGRPMTDPGVAAAALARLNRAPMDWKFDGPHAELLQRYLGNQDPPRTHSVTVIREGRRLQFDVTVE